MTKLCLTLCRSSLEENLQDLENNQVSLAELRIDLLDVMDSNDILDFTRQTSVPLILTCRKTQDGGQWTGSSQDREALLFKLLDGNFSYIDLEEDESSAVLVDKAAEQSVQIIRSFHDFEACPENLEERLLAMRTNGSLVKAAVMPHNSQDLQRLFEIGQAWKKRFPAENNLILLGMGAVGVPSRILAARMGSFLTFCSPSGAEAAPGHMSWSDLHNIYRVEQITEEWELYGIIGNPVLHTRSPQIHNPAYIAQGLKAVYVPFTVADPSLFFKLAEFLGIKGFSVTVPHKEAVRPFLAEEDEGVKAVGACNTVYASERGWSGANTDIAGFINPIKKLCSSLKGKTAAVIGAGGAARSAVYALMQEGVNVSIFNRTRERALSLAEEMGCLGASLNELENMTSRGESFDLIIQTGSAGMHGSGAGINPIEFYNFNGQEIIYDIVYSPPLTPLMEKANAAGCRVLGGMPMLQEQGAVQYRLFTGKNFPLD